MGAREVGAAVEWDCDDCGQKALHVDRRDGSARCCRDYVLAGGEPFLDDELHPGCALAARSAGLDAAAPRVAVGRSAAARYGAPVTTAADDEELFGDAERRVILENRLRQLHADLYSLEMHLSEEEADPHGNAKQVAQFRNDIQTVKTRISTVQKIHRALPKPKPKAAGDAGDAPAGDAPTG